MTSEEDNWCVCKTCKGQGKKSRGLSKKAKLNYQKELEAFQLNTKQKQAPTPPKAHLYTCTACAGAGIVTTNKTPIAHTKNYPHVAIIGGGIGGVALAVACLHRNIPFTLYERDSNFNARSQGYGLTLQQASKAMEGFGLSSLKNGVVSTRHLVHNTEGTVVGEWGNRKWIQEQENKTPKKTNIHIARQSLRLALLNQLNKHPSIKWNHQLVNFTEINNTTVELEFRVNGVLTKKTSNLVVGADGIRSTVRKLLIGNEKSPLRYLDCMVVLGICPLSSLQNTNSDLLDGATVFQTANGIDRIYIMPYDANSVMWQLSFPIEESKAKELSKQGAKALKEEACKRTQWHSPIPEILQATEESFISGYPVYDRELLKPETLAKNGAITLLGDAAHPMSPFKGQGANQALLDALSLAKTITKECDAFSNWQDVAIREQILSNFEQEMLTRSAIKVKDSAKAAQFLHTDIVLQKANQPRGKLFNKNNH